MASQLIPSFRHLAFFVLFLLVGAETAVVFADQIVDPIKAGLPFEASASATSPIGKLGKELVKYTGILAVVALSWGGVSFITSFGDEQKVKKAKNIVMYSLIGVVLSIAAYTIIDIVNSITV